MRRRGVRASQAAAATGALAATDFALYSSSRGYRVLRFLVAFVGAVVTAVILWALRDEPADAVGRAVLAGIAVVVPAFVLLAAPAAGAAVVAEEREGGTLDLLLAAPLRPTLLIAAKLGARFTALAVLALTTLPIASIALVFGGVAFATLADVYLFALAYGAAGLAVGALCSARARSVVAAVRATYALTFGAAPLLLALVAAAYHGGVRALEAAWELAPDPRLVEWLGRASEALVLAQPFVHWFWLVFRAGSGRSWGPTAATSAFAAALAGIAVLALLAAGAATRRELAPPRAARTRTRRRSASRFAEANPVFLRALRGSLLYRPRVRTFAVALLLLGLLAWFLWVAYDGHELDEEWPYVFVLGTLTLLATLGTLLATAASIATERRNGALELLLATRISATRLVLAKFGAALAAHVPLLALGVAVGAVGFIAGGIPLLSIPCWVASSTVTVAAAGALGSFVSARSKRSGKAVVAAVAVWLGVGVALAGGAIVLALVLDSFMRNEDRVATFVVSFAPPVAPYAAVGLPADRHWGSDERVFAFACTVATLAYAAATVFLLIAACRRVRFAGE